MYSCLKQLPDLSKSKTLSQTTDRPSKQHTNFWNNRPLSEELGRDNLRDVLTRLPVKVNHSQWVKGLFVSTVDLLWYQGICQFQSTVIQDGVIRRSCRRPTFVRSQYPAMAQMQTDGTVYLPGEDQVYVCKVFKDVMFWYFYKSFISTFCSWKLPLAAVSRVGERW